MKNIVLYVCLFYVMSFIDIVSAQHFLNGDFEYNTAEGCQYNISNGEFNNYLSNVFGFGSELDLQTNDCEVIPQSGDWCIGLAEGYFGGQDALTLELSNKLNSGRLYEITFYTFGNATTGSDLGAIRIGMTTSKEELGVEIYNVKPEIDVWQMHSFKFNAIANIKYISIAIEGDLVTDWIQVDNFSIYPYSVSNRIIDLNGDLSFDEVNIGESLTQNMIIINDGIMDLVISSIDYPEGYSGNWSGGTIGPGETQEVEVTFAPTEEKDYNGVVTVNSNATSGDYTISISGIGVSEPSGMEEDRSGSLIQVYPNPIKSSFTIEVEKELIGKKFTLSDHTGRNVVEGSIIDKKTKISTDNLKPGVYFLMVEGLPLSSKKIVKY